MPFHCAARGEGRAPLRPTASRIPEAPRPAAARDRGGRGLGRSRLRPGPSRAPKRAPAGLHGFWIARKPLISHKTRKYKFQNISPSPRSRRRRCRAPLRPTATRIPEAPRPAAARDRGGRGLGRSRLRPGPSRAPKRAPAGLHGFWIARKPLISHKTRKYKFQNISPSPRSRRRRCRAPLRPTASRIPEAPRPAAAGDRGGRGLGRSRLRPGPSRAPKRAPAGLHGFWIARKPLISHKTRKYKFQNISPSPRPRRRGCRAPCRA